MLTRLIDLSFNNRLLVLTLVVLMALTGLQCA